MKLKEKLRREYLVLKRKIINLGSKKFFQWLFSLDITPIFLFLALRLAGYEWNWWVFFASIGLWVFLLEVFKHLQMIMSELRKKE